MSALKPKALTGGALLFVSPENLETALDRIEKLKAAIEVGLETIERQGEKIASLENDVDLANLSATNVRLEVEAAFEYMVEDIERARQSVAIGKTADALHLLARILEAVDPKCKRLGVVVSRLPSAGSFAA